MAFQAYLIEGLARWNLQRSEASMERVEEKVPRSFDISLKHRLNALSSAIHNAPALSNFCTPPAYTGEIIGVSYLHSQTGDVKPGEVEELDRAIDEAFADLDMGSDDDGADLLDTDQTVAMPEDSGDSGNEVIL